MDALNLLGLCECGCGGQTSLAKKTMTKYGHVRGQPVRFIPGHQFRRPGPLYEEDDHGYSTPCWRWLRYTTPNGYGQFHQVLAHKVFWERENGPVPDGLELDHLCRNSACVNPAHLEPVTHAENMRRGKRTKLNPDAVREIRASPDEERELARRYGVTPQAIHKIRRRISWKDVV